jgi:hypothetical protein
MLGPFSTGLLGSRADGGPALQLHALGGWPQLPAAQVTGGSSWNASPVREVPAAIAIPAGRSSLYYHAGVQLLDCL